MDFSTINPLINNTVTGTLTLLCNGGFTNIQLSTGNSNDFNMREMNGQANGDKLKYNIYTDTAYTKITIPIIVVIITADILGLIIRTIPHIIVSTEVITDKTK